MAKISTDLSLNQKVSSPLAFVLLLLLSFVVAWYTVNVAGEIVENAKDSKIVNVEKRAEYNAKRAGFNSKAVQIR